MPSHTCSKTRYRTPSMKYDFMFLTFFIGLKKDVRHSVHSHLIIQTTLPLVPQRRKRNICAGNGLTRIFCSLFFLSRLRIIFIVQLLRKSTSSISLRYAYYLGTVCLDQPIWAWCQNAYVFKGPRMPINRYRPILSLEAPIYPPSVAHSHLYFLV